VSLMNSFRAKKFLATLSALVMASGMLVGAQVAMADSVWVQSYQRESADEACEAQADETPWQASWGPDASWKPSWEQWANNGKGGWVCTRSITWARTPVAGETSTDSYAVGDIGPGGGLVFLISDGQTYEMAPKTWDGGSGDPQAAWCNTNSNLTGASGLAVGDGSANTAAMLGVCASGAAKDVTDYQGGGFTDWYLPSQGELNAMYLYFRTPGFDAATYGFEINFYWTSSQSQFSSSNAWYQSFGNGDQPDGAKTTSLRVRPIRAF